jgi:hypothetical protein
VWVVQALTRVQALSSALQSALRGCLFLPACDGLL